MQLVIVTLIALALVTEGGAAWAADPSITLKWAWAVAPTQHMSIEAGKVGMRTEG
jgi:hypothetical protein